MEIVLAAMEAHEARGGGAEVVERKGLGHPDTICDALAEELSVGLSRFYRERFGLILHHNVDKVLLWAGQSRPRFGGGEVVEPIELYLAGRATREHAGVEVPVDDIAHESARAWFQRHFHALDFDEHVRVHTLIRPGSAELVEVFLRARDSGLWLANDTSVGAGFAPARPLERATLAVEEALNRPDVRDRHPALGEDVKVMGARVGDRVELTVGCAMVDRHLADVDAYVGACREAAGIARDAARRELAAPPEVVVNAADDVESGSIFLTVTGTSAEAGDDGQAGRGNRCNGLITPGRPMTLESVAGKNPVTHVGKLYNVMANRLAAALVDEIDEVTGAHCLVLSRIGHPIDDPRLVSLRLATARGRVGQDVRARAHAIVEREMAAVTSLWEGFLAGAYRVA